MSNSFFFFFAFDIILLYQNIFYQIKQIDIRSVSREKKINCHEKNENWQLNQILGKQMHHYKVNYYKSLPRKCPTDSHANNIQLVNFNETLVPLKFTINHLNDINERIDKLIALVAGLTTENRQQINSYLTDIEISNYLYSGDIR